MSRYIEIGALNYHAKKNSKPMIYYILRNTEILLNEDYLPVTFNNLQEAQKWCEEMNDLKPGDIQVFYQPIGTLERIIIN